MGRIAIVAHLPDYPDGGSSARRVEAFARGLTDDAVQTLLIIPLKRTVGNLSTEISGVQVRWLWQRGRLPGFLEILLSRIKLVAWGVGNIKKQSLSWLFLYNLNLEGVLLALIGRLLGCRVVTIIGDIRDFQASGPKLAALKTADYLLTKLSNLNVVDTRFLQRRAMRWAPRIPCLIVPPMVDTDRFRYDRALGEAFRTKYGLGQKCVVGYFGMFYFNQGVASLLEAVKLVADRGGNLEVLVAGHTIKEIQCDDIGRISERFGIQDRVHQLGWLSSAEVIAAMSACDILVIPRIAHPVNEAGSPTKLTEYLSMGKVVVAAAVGDIPRYHAIKQCFLMTEPGSAQSIAEALMHLVNSCTNRVALGRAARSLAESHFDYRVALGPLKEAISLAGQSSGQQHRGGRG